MPSPPSQPAEQSPGEGSTAPKGAPYPSATRLAALVAIVGGFGLIGLPAYAPLQLSATITAGVVALCVAVGGAIVTVLLLPKEHRGRHVAAALWPGLAAAGYLLLAGGPIWDLLGSQTAIRSESGIWKAIYQAETAFLAGICFGGVRFVLYGSNPTVRIIGRAIAAGLAVWLGLTIHIAVEMPAALTDLATFAALTAVLLWASSHLQTAVEFDQGLRKAHYPPLEPANVTRAYERSGDERLVGVALSGGGYRASLFAMGALLYIHDACVRSDGVRRRVAAVTSVSGGSLTNAVVGHGAKIGVDAPSRVDHVAQALVRHAAREGSMFGRGAWAYYLLLLGSALLLLLLAWVGIRAVTLDLLARAAAVALLPIVAFAVLQRVFLVLGRVSLGRFDLAFEIACMLLALAGVLATLLALLSVPEWREALAWVELVLIALLLGSLMWIHRGNLLEKNFQALIQRVSTRGARLASINPSTHHVFCATEVQFDETAYFAQDAIRSASFDWVAPGGLLTARAARASAAFPGFFAPVILRGLHGKKDVGIGERDRSRTVETSHMVLVDGGVRDNLGVDWFTTFGTEVDELVVVSAAPNRRGLRAVRRIPGISELMALLNMLEIPYNTRERVRRRAINVLLLGDPATRPGIRHGGALVHIEDSPFDLARLIVRQAEGSRPSAPAAEARGTSDWRVDIIHAADLLRRGANGHSPELVKRAGNIIDFLRDLEETLPPARIDRNTWLRIYTRGARLDQEIAWWKRVAASAVVGTKLTLIDGQSAVNLVVHGYYLAMANLHLTLDWPLTTALDTTRLEGIFGDAFLKQAPVDRATFNADRLAPLSQRYQVLVLLPVSVQVRSAGEFVPRTVVVAAGCTSDAVQRLGTWIAPSRRPPRGAAGDLFAYQARQEEYRKQMGTFWSDLLQDLRARGLTEVDILVHDVPGLGTLPPAERDGLPDAAAAAFPSARAVPRPSRFIDDVRPGLFASVEDFAPMNAELARLFNADNAATARALLDDFTTRWGERYDRLIAANKAWEPLAAFFSLPVQHRQMVLRCDLLLENARDAVGKEIDSQGAFLTEDDAMAFVANSMRRHLK
jgi:hypothetical protein